MLHYDVINYSKQLWILISQNLCQGLISLAAKIRLPEKLLQVTEVKCQKFKSHSL